jgi:hypothetical protein
MLWTITVYVWTSIALLFGTGVLITMLLNIHSTWTKERSKMRFDKRIK